MKFIASTLLMVLLSFIAGLFLPWWSIALVSFFTALLIRQSIGASFFSGFTAIFLLWGIVAFWIDIKNDHLLANKISKLFHLGESPVLLILIAAFVGGLVGAFAAMAGASLQPAKKKYRLHP